MKTKEEAMEYYRDGKITSTIELLLNKLLIADPKDPFGYMSTRLEKLSQNAQILKIDVKQKYNPSFKESFELVLILSFKNSEIRGPSLIFSPYCNFSDALPASFKLDSNQFKSLLQYYTLISTKLFNEIFSFCIYDQTALDEKLKDIIKKIEKVVNEKEIIPSFNAIEDDNPLTGKSTKITPPKPDKSGLPPPPKTTIKKIGHTALVMISMISLKQYIDGCLIRKPIPSEPKELIVLDQKGLIFERTRRLFSEIGSNTRLMISFIDALISFNTASGKCRCIKDIFIFPKKLSVLSHSSEEILNSIYAFIENLRRLLVVKPFEYEVLTKNEEELISLQSQISSFSFKTLKKLALKNGNLQLVTESGCFGVMLEKPDQILEIVRQSLDQCEPFVKENFLIGLNCTSYEIFDENKLKYEPITGITKSPDEMITFYYDIIEKFSFIGMLIDPFRNEDIESWTKLSAKLGIFECNENNVDHTKEFILSNSSGMQPVGPGLMPLSKPNSSGVASVPPLGGGPKTIEESKESGNEENEETNDRDFDKNDLSIEDMKLPDLESLPVNATGPTGPRIDEIFEQAEIERKTNGWMISFEMTNGAVLVSDIFKAVEFTQKHGNNVIFNINSQNIHPGTWILEIAVGMGCNFVKINGFQRAEQTDLFNLWAQLNEIQRLNS